MTTAKGGQPLAGSVKWLRNKKARDGSYGWHARFTLPGGKRTKYASLGIRVGRGPCCEPVAKATCEHVRAAREAARIAAERVRATGGTPDTVKETVEDYSKRWLKDREGRVNSIRDDRSRTRDHILPTLGPLDASTFGRDDVERLRDDLDRKIVKGELAWKTAASVWTLATSMAADMVNAKKRDLRTRTDNPCRDVKPPERGARKAKQYLYPSEFLTFVSCERVPLRWRRAVAAAIYTYTRDAELRVLRESDVDHGIVDITRAFNRRKPTEVKGTKSDAPRRFAVEPNLLPLFAAMRSRKGDQLVIRLPSERAMARNLRRWLWKANVRRPALHVSTATSQRLTWHDLRATGATWMAVRGDDAHKIMQRCGHRSFSTTMLYVREGEAIREGFGQPFPPLPKCLLDGSGFRPAGSDEAPAEPSETGTVRDTVPMAEIADPAFLPVSEALSEPAFESRPPRYFE
jgi:integrase